MELGSLACGVISTTVTGGSDCVFAELSGAADFFFLCRGIVR
jgi:hypothetical protein